MIENGRCSAVPFTLTPEAGLPLLSEFFYCKTFPEYKIANTDIIMAYCGYLKVMPTSNFATVIILNKFKYEKKNYVFAAYACGYCLGTGNK